MSIPKPARAPSAAVPIAGSPSAPWYRAVGPLQWKSLAAAEFAWIFDGMDMMLYALVLTTIRSEFQLTSAVAGSIASVGVFASAMGGIMGGYLADRFGRVRTLVYSMLLYSFATGAVTTSHTVSALVFWRAVAGLGLGPVWSAGSALVAETWPSEHRGKVSGLLQGGWAIGYLFAALLAGVLLPLYGWRSVFLAGSAPALFAIWIWRSVPEPELWLHSPRSSNLGAHLRLLFGPVSRERLTIATIICSCTLFAYWGLFTWIPAYLSSPISQGGAGLSIVQSSAWIVPAQIGAFLGYTSFGFLADRFGRRAVFQAFVFTAAVIVPVYGLAARSPIALLILGPLVGCFAHGFFSVFGAMLAELFPSAIRATAQGFAYNTGRAAGAFAPFVIGAAADRYGIGSALAVTSAFFIAGGIMMRFLPETKGEALS